MNQCRRSKIRGGMSLWILSRNGKEETAFSKKLKDIAAIDNC